MKTLVDIILEKKYDAMSRATVGTDKEFDHKYCSLCYDKEFEKYQDKPISLLEIGVESGGSLIVWNEYFPNATLIMGLECHQPHIQKAQHYTQNLWNVRVVNADAYNAEFVNQLPQFDIIIDDGPHDKESQLKSMNLYCNKIKPGGCYVIEDIQDIAYTEDFKTLVPEGMTYEVFDLREPSNLWDSIVFVVRKPV